MDRVVSLRFLCSASPECQATFRAGVDTSQTCGLRRSVTDTGRRTYRGVRFAVPHTHEVETARVCYTLEDLPGHLEVEACSMYPVDLAWLSWPGIFQTIISLSRPSV